MPGGRDRDYSESGAPVTLGLWDRLLVALPRLKRERDKAPLAGRLRSAFLKPAPPTAVSTAKAAPEPLSVEDLEMENRFANDKERLVGLLAAPLAGMIGLLVTSSLIANDPPAHLKNGQINRLHVSVSLYHNVTLVLLALAVLMLVTAWIRKRLYLGIVMALYGLAIFNLKYWGFGVPFIMAAAWLLVRSYRLQRELREATGEPRSHSSSRRGGPGRATSARPGSNKRYTPPVAAPKRSSVRKPDKEQRAG